MDGNAINTQVSLEEIVIELNKQIASMNFELTASKIAIQKLQNALNNVNDSAHENDQTISKINTGSF